MGDRWKGHEENKNKKVPLINWEAQVDQLSKVRTAEEIGTPTATNRWVGYPYTKYMCANDNVDGAASWLLCSVRTAKRLGVERSRWVYLLSGAQCHEGSDDKWFVSGREDLTAQPAMRSSITNCLVRHRCPGGFRSSVVARS